MNADALFAILTSDGTIDRLKEDRRDYGDGLWKLEPKELMNLWLPKRAAALAP